VIRNLLFSSHSIDMIVHTIKFVLATCGRCEIITRPKIVTKSGPYQENGGSEAIPMEVDYFEFEFL